MKKLTEAQKYLDYKRHADKSRVLSARQHAINREYKLLATTSLKHLIGKKLHIL